MSEHKNQQIISAQIDWSDESLLFSSLFGDHDQQIDRTHFLFIKENQFIKRWKNSQNSAFCIAEIGTSSLIRFLLTSALFEFFLQQHSNKPLKNLFYSRFQAAPFDTPELLLALQKWPSLAPYINPLLTQIPLALCGCHRLHINAVHLDLWLGDVNENLASVYVYKEGLYDCYFINDSALNTRNKQRTNSLLQLIASSAKPSATLVSSNTTAPLNDLLQQTGFTISKTDGEHKQIGMLVATLAEKSSTPSYQQHYRASKTTPSKEIAIIGGGISSACLTLALVKRGFNVTLYCKDKQLGSGASGNQQGALYPLLNQQHDPLSQLFANSFLYARNYVETINQSHPFDFDLSGLLQLYYDNSASKKLDKIMQASLPTTLVKKISSQQTDQLADLDIGQEALFYPLAGWLSPTQMVKAIFAKAEQSGQLTIKLERHLTRFEQLGSGWLCDFGGQQIQHDLLLLTTAMHTLDFTQCEALPLSAARGQVTHIDSNAELKKLKMTLCHEGYLTPINNGIHCMGATFKRHTMNEQFAAQEQTDNKDKLAKCIKGKAWVQQIDSAHNNANVGIRCTTRDHFPYFGAVPDYQKTKIMYQQATKEMPKGNAPFHDNLFILTGLGSRGLNSAPLLAETLASQINQEPLPLSLPILNAMQCNRQWINYLKKGKTLKL